MRILTKLTGPLAVLATFAFASAPAHAQFEGGGDQMAQFAPMMEQFAPMMIYGADDAAIGPDDEQQGRQEAHAPDDANGCADDGEHDGAGWWRLRQLCRHAGN